jgi:hypothetical protein
LKPVAVTSGDIGGVNDALELEKLQLIRSVAHGAREADKEIAQLVNQLAERGTSRSGNRYVQEGEIRFRKTAQEPVHRAIEKRKELGRKVPELLTPYRLTQLREMLEQRVEYAVDGMRQRLAIGGTGRTGVSSGIMQRMRMQADALKGSIRHDLEALRLEARLGMHSDEHPVSVNISHSTIAGLNLGTIVGDLTACVQVLEHHGHQEVAGQIQKLAETVAASPDLQEAQRRDLLEHLSLISTEAGLPPEKRKLAPLRSSLAALKSELETAAELAVLWPPIEHLLKSMGVHT